MNLLIINTLPVPSGQASVNRILSLGKGLVENGDTVTIISSAKSEDIKFHDINGVKCANFADKKNKVLGLVQALIRILKHIRKNRNEIDSLWVVSNSPLLIWPLYFECKYHNIKFIMEKSEFPFVLMKKGLVAKLWAKI